MHINSWWPKLCFNSQFGQYELLKVINDLNQLCPKCSANPITVTPIWIWKFENKEHPIRGLYRSFFEKFLLKFPFSHKIFQMGQKIYFYQLYKLKQKSSTNPISVCKWEIAPSLLLRILGYVFFNLNKLPYTYHDKVKNVWF